MESSSHNALIKITKITKESTSIAALCETSVMTREEQGRRPVQSCGHGLSPTGNGIPQQASLGGY